MLPVRYSTAPSSVDPAARAKALESSLDTTLALLAVARDARNAYEVSKLSVVYMDLLLARSEVQQQQSVPTQQQGTSTNANPTTAVAGAETNSTALPGGAGVLTTPANAENNSIAMSGATLANMTLSRRDSSGAPIDGSVPTAAANSGVEQEPQSPPLSCSVSDNADVQALLSGYVASSMSMWPFTAASTVQVRKLLCFSFLFAHSCARPFACLTFRLMFARVPLMRPFVGWYFCFLRLCSGMFSPLSPFAISLTCFSSFPSCEYDAAGAAIAVPSARGQRVSRRGAERAAHHGRAPLAAQLQHGRYAWVGSSIDEGEME